MTVPSAALHTRWVQRSAALSILFGAVALPAGWSQDFRDTIGLTTLRQRDSTLTGSGVKVAQVEAPATAGGLDFEVNPATSGILQTAPGFLTYYSTNGTSNVTGDSVGSESGHADTVGSFFYGAAPNPSPGGAATGVAPGVAHVDNYEAGDFINSIVAATSPPAIPAKIVNQSFVVTTSQQALLEKDYDTYADTYNTLFVSGAGNGGAVQAPSTAYNSLSVAAYGGFSSTGPTGDGRSKPDLTAPAAATSFSTPQVSGAAATLVQAGARGDGGASSTTRTDAQDLRTLKALLLNGAVQPADWVHTATTPLDPRYGAGILNIDHSYTLLAAGEHAATLAGIASSGATGDFELPPSSAGNESSLLGWNETTLTNPKVAGSYVDVADHYFFSLAGPATYNVTCTLVWNRQAGQTAINNLDFFLLNAATGAVLNESVSTVDNVEELSLTGLAPGQYDLEVFKNASGQVTPDERYAVAYQFTAVPEPSNCLLLAAGGAAVCTRRLRRSFRAVASRF